MSNITKEDYVYVKLNSQTKCGARRKSKTAAFYKWSCFPQLLSNSSVVFHQATFEISPGILKSVRVFATFTSLEQAQQEGFPWLQHFLLTALIQFARALFTFQISLQVSWVRHRDVHLLTVGRYTYTSDQRFRAIHQPHSEDWTLQIKYPQHRDSGIYECQVSSTPHLSHFIHLTVIGELFSFIFISLSIYVNSRNY